MDIEKLKICAEALGHVTCKPAYIVGPTDKMWILQAGETIEYDPEHNDAQMAGLLKWLIDRGIQIDRGENCYWICGYNDNKHLFQVEGQTLNQAVINAVWEVKNG